MHQFRDKSVAQRELRVRRAALLPRPDGRRRARLPRARGAGGRGPARARRAHARCRRALQPPLRRDAGRARGADPDGRRAHPRPAGPVAEDVDHLPSPAGTVYVLDEPDAIIEEVQARGDRLGHGDRPRPGKPGFEPDRDPRGDPRDERPRMSSTSSPTRATATSRSRWRGGRRVPPPGARALHRAARGRGRARADPGRGAPRVARALAGRDARRRARAHGRRL